MRRAKVAYPKTCFCHNRCVTLNLRSTVNKFFRTHNILLNKKKCANLLSHSWLLFDGIPFESFHSRYTKFNLQKNSRPMKGGKKAKKIDKKVSPCGSVNRTLPCEFFTTKCFHSHSKSNGFNSSTSHWW